MDFYLGQAPETQIVYVSSNFDPERPTEYVEGYSSIDPTKEHIKLIKCWCRDGKEIVCILKTYGTETNFKGDAFKNELAVYKYAATHSLPVPELLLAGKIQGMDLIIIPYYPNINLLHELTVMDDPSFAEFEEAAIIGLNLLVEFHLKGIRHNDPDTVNIICFNTNGQKHAKLIDFAQATLDHKSAVYMPELNTMLGHLIYRMFGSTYYMLNEAYARKDEILDNFIANLKGKNYEIVEE